MQLVFAERALKNLQKIPQIDRVRILTKLEFMVSQQNPIYFAEPLKGTNFGDYRFRIGNYRVLCEVRQGALFILKVGHRKDIYR